MKRDEEQRRRTEIERVANEPDAWEQLADAAPLRRGTLGAQVTVRLSPEYADRLRRIARARGVGYTSLLRDWVERKIRTEEVSTHVSVVQGGHTEHEQMTVQINTRDREPVAV